MAAQIPANGNGKIEVTCGDLSGVFFLKTSLVQVGGIVSLTANNFERIAGKMSNKWRDTIKIKVTPADTALPAKNAAPSLREWAARVKVPLVDPDVEEAIAAAHIPYDDERVPHQAVGPGQAAVPIGEGWVAVEDLVVGGFAVGYIWRNQQGELMHIPIHPEPAPKGPRDVKRRRGEREPRARLFNPALCKWFALGGDPLPHPERLELLTHPQAMPTLMQAPPDLVAALQKKLDDAACGVQCDLRLDSLSAEHKRQIKVARDKEGRSEGSIRVAGQLTKHAEPGDLSKDGFLRRPDAVARAILAMLTARPTNECASAEEGASEGSADNDIGGAEPAGLQVIASGMGGAVRGMAFCGTSGSSCGAAVAPDSFCSVSVDFDNPCAWSAATGTSAQQPFRDWQQEDGHHRAPGRHSESQQQCAAAWQQHEGGHPQVDQLQQDQGFGPWTGEEQRVEQQRRAEQPQLHHQHQQQSPSLAPEHRQHQLLHNELLLQHNPQLWWQEFEHHQQLDLRQMLMHDGLLWQQCSPHGCTVKETDDSLLSPVLADADFTALSSRAMEPCPLILGAWDGAWSKSPPVVTVRHKERPLGDPGVTLHMPCPTQSPRTLPGGGAVATMDGAVQHVQGVQQQAQQPVQRGVSADAGDEWAHLTDAQLEQLACETASRLGAMHAALYMREVHCGGADQTAGGQAVGTTAAPNAKRARVG